MRWEQALLLRIRAELTAVAVEIEGSSATFRRSATSLERLLRYVVDELPNRRAAGDDVDGRIVSAARVLLVEASGCARLGRTAGAAGRLSGAYRDLSAALDASMTARQPLHPRGARQ